MSGDGMLGRLDPRDERARREGLSATPGWTGFAHDGRLGLLNELSRRRLYNLRSQLLLESR